MADKQQDNNVSASQLPESSEFKWYVIYSQPNYENAVCQAIKQRVEATDTDHMVAEVFVPVQKKIVVKNGKQQVKEEKIFPGYVLIKMILNSTSWDIVAGTEGVKGFVKTDKYPRALAEQEVQAIMKYMEIEQPSYKSNISVDEAVRIIDDAFSGMIGTVVAIDEAKGKVTVNISFFGQETPIELQFSQVEKL